VLLEVLEAHIDEDVRHALEEDVGQGDITAQLVPANGIWKASVYSRDQAILCGRNWFDAVFHHLDEDVDVRWYAADGDEIAPHQVVCTLKGPARSLLTGERTALNFLQTLSGTATLSHYYAQQIKGLGTRILDTRKTVPGLRRAQKYAVRAGGCHNHRMGLYDAFLIKENHVAAAGSIADAVKNARALNSHLPIEVEVETLDELQQALQAGTDRVMLDNFPVEDVRKAVTLASGKAELEASGGITLDKLRAYAETGVDYISIGALTKDVKAVDLSMRFD
jgi:nicotinate-nucleotide pyrophosphorylase (carboxylating)